MIDHGFDVILPKTIRDTSDEVCKILVNHLFLTDGNRVLEPSCGEGKIVEYLLNNYDLRNTTFDLVELNEQKYEVAKAKFSGDPMVRVHHKDFLGFISDTRYDRIIACPPFKGGMDVRHIHKMYEGHLAKGGVMVTLTDPSWITNNEPYQIEFREWLTGKDYFIKLLPENSFREKGKSINTGLLKIIKK